MKRKRARKKGGGGGERRKVDARDVVIIRVHTHEHTDRSGREEIAVEEAEGRHGRVHGHETRICVVILWK